jgi:hypothetical protein
MSYLAVAPYVTPEQFKRSGDADDTASFLRAFDYFRTGQTDGSVGRQVGCTLWLSGGYTISDTLLISSIGLSLKGEGWGNSKSPRSGTWIKWNGSAGIAMIKFLQTWNAGLDNIRIVGNSAARPSAAVEFADAATDSFVYNTMNRVFIGPLSGYDTDQANQFENGIVASGNINGDSNTFTHVSIVNCANVGFDIQNPNFTGTNCDGLFINYCAIGLKIRLATISGSNWFFGGHTDTCFRLLDGCKVMATSFMSEQCARIATFDPGYGSGKLWLPGGAFQVMNAIAADGRVIDTGSAVGWNIDLDNFTLQMSAGYTGPVPKIRAYNPGAANGRLSMRGVKGIYPNNLELGSWTDVNDSRNVIYEPAAEFAQDTVPRQAWTGDYTDPVDRTFRVFASDQQGEHRQRGGPFIVKRLPIVSYPSATALLGTGGTPYSYKITALTYDGETVPTAAATCTNGTPLAAGSKVNKISWIHVQGAYAYRVYGRTSGSELLLKTVTWNDLHSGLDGGITPPSWNDDGSLTPSGALPAVNTTGNSVVEGQLQIGTSFAPRAQIKFIPVSAPASPVDGEMWFDGTNVKFRTGGVTKTFTLT